MELELAFLLSEIALAILTALAGLIIGLAIRSMFPERVPVLVLPEKRIEDIEEIVVGGRYFLPSMTSDQLRHRSWRALYDLGRPWRHQQAGNTVVLTMDIEAMDKKKKDYFEGLNRTKDAAPVQITVIIVESERSGLLVEARCIPALYRKITQQKRADVSAADVSACRHECAELLRSLFVGGLRGQEVEPASPKVERRLSVLDFLVNRPTEKPLTKAVTSALESAQSEVCFAGWLGGAGVPFLSKAKNNGAKVRVITHTPSKKDKDKQRAFSELLTLLGAESIRMEPSFHGRILIVDDFVLIGSLDLSSESLNERTEPALWTNSVDVLQKAKQLFDELFQKGSPPRVQKRRKGGAK